jgi:hypothetical protein
VIDMLIDPITTFDLVSADHRERLRAAAALHHRIAGPEATVRRRRWRRGTHSVVWRRPGLR